MQTLAVVAPAKINLSLRILGRRPDGYHELDSIFLPLDLADQVEVKILPEARRVECLCVGHPELDGAENLAARAARLFLEASDLGVGVSIQIQKRIWIAAGLGGGSSDAAAVLLALAELLGEPRIPLAELARRLGADLPFFLDPRPARAAGIGERLTPLANLRSWPVVLLNPRLPLSTARVFATLGLEKGEVGPSTPHTDEELAWLSSSPWRLLGNDLRPAALRLLPRIAELEQALAAEGARGVSLSGSGPTVFGIFDELERARRAASRLARAQDRSVLLAMTASS
jgi:4-diphosphocytidyl-2-C-methyl-D-erythritol kinase